MDSDEGKLFIGGIAWDTSEETLTEYFTQYGQVTQAVIMREKPTGRPRGFGFVVFSDPSVLDRVLQDRHTIDGRTGSAYIHLFVPVDIGFALCGSLSMLQIMKITGFRTILPVL
ncbi:heterogeneous nuclear ribonucleoprotein 1-like [Quercus suber]|uniref:Heterogeneous nuclear ribonucleoprotein 1 n=1 Tax=Quercus suber TaxID=58331 RepID=A0AAW0K8Z6_QUESU